MCTHVYTFLHICTGTHAHTTREKTGKVNTEMEKKTQLKRGEDPLQWISQGPGVNCGNYVPIV